MTPGILKTKFGYIYINSEKEISPQEIKIKKTNLLNFSKVIYQNKNPNLEGREIFEFVPFWIKKIEVSSKFEVDNQIIEANHIYYPYFEYGIYSFWLLPIPFMWEFMRKIPLIKIGKLKDWTVKSYLM